MCAGDRSRCGTGLAKRRRADHGQRLRATPLGVGYVLVDPNGGGDAV
jgi:hypothetical protein